MTLFSHFFNWAIGDSNLWNRFPEKLYWSFPNVAEMLVVLSLFSFWIGLFELFKITTALITIDFLVDVSQQAEFKHRCQLLRDPKDKDINFERSLLFYYASHLLSNLYVVVLECGRLYGHIKRMDLHHGIFRRFDWHCGQLVNSPQNFRRREGMKFSFFVVAFLMYWFGKIENPIIIIDKTCPNFFEC